MGLTSAYAAVRQHEGWVTIDSEPGRGSSFRLYFALIPVAGEADCASSREKDRNAPAPEASANDGMILLVEDEKVVREMTRVVLEAKGFQVISAANGPEAMKAWQRRKDAITLLITDLVMPMSMSGADLAKTLREDKPGLKVIYISGYSPEIDGIECDDDSGVFLAKPFTGDSLAQTVRSVLDGS